MISPLAIDLTGQRFGRLTVLSMHPSKKDWASPKSSGGARALCRCDCGNLRMCSSQALRGLQRSRPTACVPCMLAQSKAKTSENGRKNLSVKLADGRTIGEVAAAAGLPINLVYYRHRRGWPDWRLGQERTFTTKRRSA